MKSTRAALNNHVAMVVTLGMEANAAMEIVYQIDRTLMPGEILPAVMVITIHQHLTLALQQLPLHLELVVRQQPLIMLLNTLNITLLKAKEVKIPTKRMVDTLHTCNTTRPTWLK